MAVNLCVDQGVDTLTTRLTVDAKTDSEHSA